MVSNEKSKSKDLEQSVMNQTEAEKGAKQVGHFGSSVAIASCTGSELSVSIKLKALPKFEVRL